MVFAWVALIAAPGATAADEPVKRPNVVVIMADDLGGVDLGCYGSRYHLTPNIDRLAADGVRVTTAYAACPVCSPTRASLLTGKFPARLGITDWLPGRPDRPDQALLRPVLTQNLPANEVTLAELFRDAGYQTAHIGKWHLGGKGSLPQDHGYDLNIAGDETGTPLSYIAPFQQNGRFMPGLEKADSGEYLTDRLTTEAVKFIEANRSRPFLLSLSHYAPHTPLTARPDLQKKWDARERSNAPGAQANPTYAAMLESIDESVGRIRQALENSGLAERTVIIFTSDNGGLATSEGPRTPSTFNSPLREGKGFLYEGGIRVPMIFTWPGRIPAGTNNGPVCSIDILPTLAELCAVTIKAPVDGVSVATSLLNQAPTPERSLFWHYPHYSNQRSRPGAAIRKGGLKLIEFYESGRRELFDLTKDVSESQNIALERPNEVAALAAELAEWRKSVGAQMMTPNLDYRPNPQADDGSILLQARSARVEGAMLRYEPLPHKETLGFWVRESDWAHWEFTVTEPGKFTMQILQGCGPGSGGSTVDFKVGEQSIRTTVEETKHFQDFKLRDLGEIEIKQPGRFRLEVRPVKKPGVAVMDLREVRLVPKT